MTAAPTPWWTRRPGAASLAVLLACAAVYLPFLRGEWVWDDRVYIFGNRAYASGDGLRTLLTHDLASGAGQPPGDVYRPFAFLTIWLQAQAHGLSLVPLRLGNIAILLAGAWALGRWLVRQGLGRGVATVVAALWMLHPLGVEPTLWISGRHDLLAAACTFGALAMWPLPEERAWTRVLGATALCALGVASKESAVVVPVLLAFDGLRRRSAGHALATRGWVWLVPWAGVLAVLGLRKALGIGTASASMFSAPLSVLQSAGALLLTYVPRMLSLRAGPTVLAWSPAPLWAALMALAAAAGLSLGLWATSGRRRDATLAWAAYGVTFTGVALAPLVLAVPVTRLVGNRYGHLPAAGLLLVAVVLVHRYVVPNVRVLWVKVVGVAVLFTCLAGVVDEASAWRDDLTLFGRAVTMAPEDGVARYHLGVAVHRRQGCEAALGLFAAATRQAPWYAQAWNSRAGCLLRMGRPAEALASAHRAVALQPVWSKAMLNVALAYLALGNVGDGRRWLDRVLTLDPQDAEALQARARLTP